MCALKLFALAERLHASDNGIGVRVFWRWSPIDHRDFLTISFDGELPVAQHWKAPNIFRDATLRLRAELEDHRIKVSDNRLVDAMRLIPHTPTHLHQARADVRDQARELGVGRYRRKNGHGDPRSN